MRRRHNRNPLPEIGELIVGAPTLGLPLALVATEIAERALEHRQPILERMGWKFEESVFRNAAEIERAFGLLTQAPLSEAQAAQEHILRSMNLREWNANDFAGWVRARTASPRSCMRGDHETYKRDLELWDMLPMREDWAFEDEVLEQRDCPECGSTLARPKRIP